MRGAGGWRWPEGKSPPQWLSEYMTSLPVSGRFAPDTPPFFPPRKTFLFSDTQIVEPSFLEDVNGMLGSGEVANLFASVCPM